MRKTLLIATILGGALVSGSAVGNAEPDFELYRSGRLPARGPLTCLASSAVLRQLAIDQPSVRDGQ